MAAPTFVSSAPANSLTVQTTTTMGSVTLPATQANDILCLLAVNGGAVTALTVTGGTYTGSWTSIGALATTTGWGGVWWSRATGNHTGQTVTTGIATNSTATAVLIVRGVKTTGSPINGTPSSAQQTTTNAPSPASITTSVNECLIVYTILARDNIAWSGQLMGGVAMTERVEVGSSGGADSLVGAATLAQTTAGATGVFSGTHATALGKVGIAFALERAAVVVVPQLVMMAPYRGAR